MADVVGQTQAEVVSSRLGLDMINPTMAAMSPLVVLTVYGLASQTRSMCDVGKFF